MIEFADFDLMKGLSPEVIEGLAKHIHSRKFPKKSQIITEGDDSQCLYFVQSGRVKVFLDDDSGKEIIVNFHEEGDFFGELGLIEGVRRTASVVTVEDSVLGMMSKSDFQECLSTFPDFSFKIIHNLSSRLMNATETIRRLGLMDVYGRIVVTFLNLTEEKDGKRIVKERLTQQEIANRVGASREMVARILKDLRVGGYVSIEGGIIQIEKPLPHSW